MSKRLLSLLVCTTIGLVGLAGCSQNEDPWTKGYAPKGMELQRSPEQQGELRERLLKNQIDRDIGIQQINRT